MVPKAKIRKLEVKLAVYHGLSQSHPDGVMRTNYGELATEVGEIIKILQGNDGPSLEEQVPQET